MKKLFGEFDKKTLKIKYVDLLFRPPKEWKKVIDKNWNKLKNSAKTVEGKIWNGKVYRFAALRKNKKTTLYLEKTDFKTLRAIPLLKSHLREIKFNERPNGMYITSFLISADGKLIFGLRGKHSTSKYKINLLGGVLNENEKEINKTIDLYNYLTKELREETGFTKKDIASINGLGIFVADDYKIFILFKTNLSILSKEFLERVKPNSEHDKFFLVPKNQLRKFIKSNKDFINPLIKKLVPLLD